MRRNYKKLKSDTVAQTQDELFREKARHYLVCFIDTCPLREQCLRWYTGHYIDTTRPSVVSVNPRHPQMGSDSCPFYREKKQVVMKCGLTQMYYEMPEYMAHNIRRLLIGKFGRKQYFEMRKGDRLINPEQQDVIVKTCRHCGWQGPIVYDGEQEEWSW